MARSPIQGIARQLQIYLVCTRGLLEVLEGIADLLLKNEAAIWEMFRDPQFCKMLKRTIDGGAGHAETGGESTFAKRMPHFPGVPACMHDNAACKSVILAGSAFSVSGRLHECYLPEILLIVASMGIPTSDTLKLNGPPLCPHRLCRAWRYSGRWE
ncbi:MAG: hypothetical protein MPJ78_18740, partial [Hyphomicrobiaceae bacterium]|nr:hypothetical protein [Hyphomicrobiaceae bacterium]